MLFNSFHYIVFFPLVAVLYFVTPHAYRWALLFVASCYFYMCFIPQFILILFAVILIDYVAAIWIEASQGRRRRLFLLASIVANLGILGVFKYFNFFNENLSALFRALGIEVAPVRHHLILPIGLSFHTFQSLSYTIEVFRGRQRAERHLGVFAVYVLFFPQMVAGPIERPQHLLPQLHAGRDFSYAAAVSGMRLILLGFCKKVLIADNLGVFVDKVYSDPTGYSAPALALATYFFAFQIYCDFSGYTDIARGSARILGVELMKNFEAPYLSRSVAEFWRRWHISLSTWFRDYVYIPLGGNRVAPLRQHFNIIVVFLLSGLWHGASWTFVIWGAMHGVWVAVGVLTRDHLKWRIPGASPLVSALRVIVTFHLVCFAWIFFRASSLGDAFHICRHLAVGWGSGLPQIATGMDLGARTAVLCAALLAGLLGFEAIASRVSVPAAFQRLPLTLRWGCYYAALVVLVFFGRFGSRSFIYFQF